MQSVTGQAYARSEQLQASCSSQVASAFQQRRASQALPAAEPAACSGRTSTVRALIRPRRRPTKSAPHSREQCKVRHQRPCRQRHAARVPAAVGGLPPRARRCLRCLPQRLQHLPMGLMARRTHSHAPLASRQAGAAAGQPAGVQTAPAGTRSWQQRREGRCSAPGAGSPRARAHRPLLRTCIHVIDTAQRHDPVWPAVPPPVRLSGSCPVPLNACESVDALAARNCWLMRLQGQQAAQLKARSPQPSLATWARPVSPKAPPVCLAQLEM